MVLAVVESPSSCRAKVSRPSRAGPTHRGRFSGVRVKRLPQYAPPLTTVADGGRVLFDARSSTDKPAGKNLSSGVDGSKEAAVRSVESKAVLKRQENHGKIEVLGAFDLAGERHAHRFETRSRGGIWAVRWVQIVRRWSATDIRCIRWVRC